MGCILDRPDINDVHSDTFSVINVDDQGNPTYEGHIKVTQTTLELFKRGSPPISWPLKSIRRYGKDAEAKCFTFESGRRCPTGPGVYVFRCSRTQQLFERVQCYVRQSTESDTNVRRSSFGRIIEAEPPISPRATEAPIPNSISNQSQLSNNGGTPSNSAGQHNNQYVNINVDPQKPKQPPVPPIMPNHPSFAAQASAEMMPTPNSAAHYENLTIGAMGASSLNSPLSPPPMVEDPFEDEDPKAVNFQINYATLELSPMEANNNQNSDSDEGQKDEDLGESSIRPRDYALIDFDRTQALSQAVRPLHREGQGAECAQELGIRKTRHNSTLESICTLQT